MIRLMDDGRVSPVDPLLADARALSDALGADHFAPTGSSKLVDRLVSELVEATTALGSYSDGRFDYAWARLVAFRDLESHFATVLATAERAGRPLSTRALMQDLHDLITAAEKETR